MNVLIDEGAGGVARAYTPHKLALKDVYVPANVFHLNQNIAPNSRD